MLSYLAVRRSNEIGIRMALGSSRSRVVLTMGQEAALLIVIGLGVGTSLALATGRLAQSMLYGLQSRDPLTLLAAVSVVAFIASIASCLPALRAARIDPMLALREE